MIIYFIYLLLHFTHASDSHFGVTLRVL